MVRTNDLEMRKKEILAAAIDSYIRSAAPVSSEALVKEYRLNVSPATVRNIFAELEREGHLTHPHTSAGRIPTQKGYRYYVDYLMKEIQLLSNEKQRIETEYKRNIRQLEGILDKASQALSDLTHCTGIASLSDNSNLVYRGASFMVDQPEFKNIEKIKRVLQLLDEKQQLLELINRDLEKRIGIYIGSELHWGDVDNCSLVVSHYKIHDKPSGSLAVLGPIRMQYPKVVSALEYMSQLMEDMLEDF